MTRAELFGQIQKKKSFLCVGLDTDLNKIPKHLLDTEDPIFEFNKQIIDATAQYAVAYKPNIAFYEAYGVKGWQSLEKTIAYIPKDIFILADAKRGDIGNTSKMYAKAFFENMDCDALTVAPYMGEDSVKPFLEFKDKWVILLALTSNTGGKDFQNLDLTQGGELFEEVLRKSQEWGTADQLMYVVGATRAEVLTRIRKIVPNHFLLVPGVGAQGGSLKDVAQYGMNSQCGLLVNSSRGIIYASQKEDFAEIAGEKAQELQLEMQQYLSDFCNLRS
ncbi:orotidine-5'-phosphate decarboxylase [Roseivirga echinicomitans]|uniref:Orotidine 5'-phosphate decarboxylase n=1 Tax=Roseivirga echinicomitans TaxID=296218 RepID=A0A150XJH0_9BACT|nr:orotidine-5'-phosphate decarboxylase [Roseivirga echinicomitans]KYG78864.1 orotidine 5'-phosphate decarboxylase [Roseivirga echinicomitans]